VHYAQNAGINIAYQVVGGGAVDLILVCGTCSHLELFWSDPDARQMFEDLGRTFRVILFDKPGTGLSDPVPAAPTIDQRTDDVVAVLDAVGSERAVVVGYSEGGLPAMMLAATRPERVEALVLLETAVSMQWREDMEVPRAHYERFWATLDEACQAWGQGVLLSALAPTWAADPRYQPLMGPAEQTCMSPSMARSVLQSYRGQDLCEVARTIGAPTIVLQGHNDFVTHEMGREAARRIPGARFVELPGRDHIVWIHNAERVVDAIVEFVTGRPAAPHDHDRVLTTVVSTDIVDSTRRLADMGDARWRAVLAEHDRLMDDLLDRLEGVAVKHTGDGRLCHFARPARAVRFAVAMTEAARTCGLEIRAGLHTGECEAVGTDLFGLAVNVACRVAACAAPSEVLVSSTVKDLVIGSGLVFEDRGARELKGVPGTWPLYRCADDRPGPLVAEGYDTDVRARPARSALPSA
jgi:pimeloyl-ACP methyl ester carboxylesterase